MKLCNCSLNEVCYIAIRFVCLPTFYFLSKFTIVYKNEYNKDVVVVHKARNNRTILLR